MRRLCVLIGVLLGTAGCADKDLEPDGVEDTVSAYMKEHNMTLDSPGGHASRHADADNGSNAP